jgi:hypothetical protein
MNTGDDKISAWLDGSLDKDGAARMTHLAATDHTVAMRALRLRHLDELVRSAVPAEDTVPQELLERLGLAAPMQGDDVVQGSGVVDLAEARRAREDASSARQDVVRGKPSALWRMAAQVAIVAGIGVSLAIWKIPGENKDEPRADYRTLSNASVTTVRLTNALIMFAPGTDEGAARAIASAAGAQLLGKPNGAGAWKAAIVPGRRDAVLAALREDGRVTMAEAVDGTAP